jgi:uracil-DNA glycosylase
MGEGHRAGLKAAAERLAALHANMRRCRRCLDAGYTVVPSAVFSGPVTAQIMLVGQAPGESEVEAQRPFNGSAGSRLFDWLSEAGWTEQAFRQTQYISAITKCYPGKASGGRGDRAPSRAEQRLCAPFLEEELALVAPDVLVAVGAIAVRRFVGQVKLSSVVGHIYRRGDRWVIPLPHPSGANLWLNRSEHKELVRSALAHIERESSRRALLTG